MAEFVLVHGGLAGAWCWELLEPELHRLGHRTLAMVKRYVTPEAGAMLTD